MNRSNALKNFPIIATCSVALAVVGMSCGIASAALLINEPFGYANGSNLVGQTAPNSQVWAAHSGAGTKPIKVNDGTISVVQSTGGAEDVNLKTGTTMAAGDTWYSSFQLKVTTPVAAGVAFAHFLETATNFQNRLWILPPTTSGFKLGLSNSTSTAPVAGSTWATDLSLGTSYGIVMSYDFNSKVQKLWVNPITAASTSVSLTSSFSSPLVAFAFRQATPATGSNTEVIGNLKVATTFVEAVPLPSTLVVFAVGSAVVGAARRRFRSLLS